MKITKIIFFLSIFLIFTVSTSFAQSGGKDISENKVSGKNSEKVRFLNSANLSRFIEELNELGKLGYRVDRAFNFGGDANLSQGFGAVLNLESGNTYEYDWLTSPNKNYLESRINFRAESGYYAVQTFALTACDDKTFESDIEPLPQNSTFLRLTKGDVFLLERKNGNVKKTKDYKVFVGKIGIGKNPSKELQTALDTVSKEYRPFKILFNRGGLLDFSVSILLEDDLNQEVSQKTDYKFVKQINGFEKEVNSPARNGYRFLSGRRVGMIKYALMAKDSDTAVSYNFIDQNKYEKDLAKNFKQGDVFQSLFIGDSDCDASKTTGGKLVFLQPGKDARTADHKYLRLTDKKNNSPTDETATEVKRLLAESYRISDVFYSDGVVLVFTK